MSEHYPDQEKQKGTDARIATLEVSFDNMNRTLTEFKGDVSNKFAALERHFDNAVTELKPKQLPWLAIAGFTLTAVIFVSAILGAFVMYHASPIIKDVDNLSRKVDRETVAVETRLTALIDAQRRDVQSFKDATNRDLQWNYANQNLRHDFTTKNVERIWAKVFAGEPPSYQPPARPTQ